MKPILVICVLDVTRVEDDRPNVTYNTQYVFS